METFRWDWPRILTAAIAALLLCAEAASAETVIARRRIGNNPEAMTYDPFNDRAVVMDGNDVIGVALNALDSIVLATMRNDDGGLRGNGFRKLFDVLALPLEARQPKGIGYVPTQRRYYFTSDEPGGTGTFYCTDEAGHPCPSLVLKGLAAPVDFWESLAWIPPGAPAHRGTLAALGYRNSEGVSHLYYVRLDGTVEQELVPQPGTPLETYFCGVAYQPSRPATLLLDDCFSGIFGMDLMSGVPVGDQPLAPLPKTPDSEGILVRNDGSVMVTTFEGRLCAYDRALHRTPQNDRGFSVGLGVPVHFLTWNFDANEFIGIAVGGDVFALSADLAVARPLLNLEASTELQQPSMVTYLGGNQLAVSAGGPAWGIGVVQMVSDDTSIRPNGTSVARLFWDDAPFLPHRAYNPRGLSLLDPADPTTFVFRGIGDANALKVVTTRGGTPNAKYYPDAVTPVLLPDIRLSTPTGGVAAQVFDNGQGKRIFTGAEIYGMDGSLIHRIDWRRLGLSKQADNGVWIGGNTFATVDGLTGTVVIYSLE